MTKKNKAVKISQTGSRSHGAITSLVRFNPSAAVKVLFNLKINLHSSDIYSSTVNIFNDKKIIELAYGPQFPQKISQLFSTPVFYRAANPMSELIWGISRCLPYAEELNQFVQLKFKYEKAIVENKRSICYALLDEIENLFGQSIWLIENRLSSCLFFDGIDEFRKLLKILESECSKSYYLNPILYFISKRTEATGYRGYLKSELHRISDEIKHTNFKLYLKAKIFEIHTIDVDDVSALLLYEGHSSLIDYYETIISVSQCASIYKSIPESLVSQIERPLLSIFKKVNDRRLLGTLRGFGIVNPTQITPNSARVQIIEEYSKGQYEKVLEASNNYLLSNCDDMPIQVIRLRSAMFLQKTLKLEEGALKDSLDNLYKVFLKSEDTYVAAFDLIKISERFYNHSWIGYLDAVLTHELRSESIIFPPNSLRKIYILDHNLTPFSLLASNKLVIQNLTESYSIDKTYPITWGVYEILINGTVNLDLGICNRRLIKYSAIHNISFGSAELAIEKYEWLLKNTYDSERVRYAAGASLSYLRNGNLSLAIDMAVSAYLENDSAPTILPITELTNKLPQPIYWPNSISVVLLLQLYDEFCEGDKFANLAYAFETFNINNNITDPSDLLIASINLEKKEIIYYLNKVWKPEVMKRTILYSGTKEIEEARIKVCQLLSELDPDNANVYKEEIKDRVKQLEITKGTSLLEQSKVYVDIEAIKKSLKSKLNDSYSRYKSLSSNDIPRIQDSKHIKISEVITSIAESDNFQPSALSTFHLQTQMDITETDIQFEAIFSEVTNEFLRGTHGLNAYLSTTVRHGTLSNVLRKPVINEGLVTSKEEGKNHYIRNTFWTDFEARSPNLKKEWKEILDALDKFSMEFDSAIEYIKNELIQIRIHHEGKLDPINKNALFIYQSSNLERMYFQEMDKSFDTMDELIDYCVENLWHKTDQNLNVVRNKLDLEVRNDVMQPFENVTIFLNKYTHVHGVQEIINAVGRAKTQTNTKFNQVVSWFKRSEVYDRQDYAPEYALDIALNMVKNTITKAANWDGVKREIISDSQMLPGRTLDGLVYLFYGLLENAILHSNVDIDKLTLKAKLSFENGNFETTVQNNLSSQSITEKEKINLISLQDSIKKGDSLRRAQREGRSGLHKIWATINSPIYKDPFLTFNYIDNNEFMVNLKFKLENIDE